MNARLPMSQKFSSVIRRVAHGFLSRAAGWALVLVAGAGVASAAEKEKPASYYHEIVPIFKRSCSGCHHPGKLKGQLDLTTYEAFKKGGKHGPGFVAGKPKESIIVDEVSGSEPSMPKEGDSLTSVEVALIERWIQEGANDDTPAGAGSLKLSEAPVYTSPPVISALAFSRDGARLAVSGYHEVLLLAGAESNITARLVGESPRIEALAFSPDGKHLAVAASAPARFGEVQIWDANASGTSLAPPKSFKVALDSVYGISWSPDGDRLAFGGADKSVRIIAAADGKELLKFDNHSDWVFATTWTTNGQRILSGSRDRAMKLIDAKTSQFIDDINKLLEGVLCFARHPKEDLVAYGGDLGVTRIYKIGENQGRTAANNDSNLTKEFDRMPGAVQAIAYAPDGNTICVGSVGGEARIYNTNDRKRVATLKGHEGAIFAIAYHPSTNQVVTGGYDGRLRVFETGKGELVRSFVPVPLRAPAAVQQAAR
jgi:mono/diheme cytochrome c family protein